MSHNRQIFATMSPRRWRTVQFVGGAVLSVIAIGIGIIIYSATHPNIPILPKNFTRCDKSPEQLAKDSTISWGSHAAKAMQCCQQPKRIILHPLSNEARVPMPEQVRAAFFVNWDEQSYWSLSKNIDKLNMLIPDWLVLGDTDTVQCTIHEKAFQLMARHKAISVIPTLSNFHNGAWRADNLNKIISNAEKRHFFIKNLVDTLSRYGFQGVNFHFEDIQEEWKNDYILFLQEAYAHLRAAGLLMAQTIVPFNTYVDIEVSQHFADMIFVLAYNKHYETGEPEPIADLNWLNGIMHNISAKIPAQKLILCLPSFGMDWGKKDEAPKQLTYRSILSIAEEAGVQVIFDKNTQNLECTYTDNERIAHKIFFADAATHFNQIRLADNRGWRGVASWRLGSEDPRIWQFYNKDLSTEALKAGSFDIQSLKTAIIPEDVEYIGEGEVMDVVSEHPTEGSIKLSYDLVNQLVVDEVYEKLPTSYVVQKFGRSADKKLVLTFDDGPDADYTPQVLDILKRENVPAAFFLIGKNIDKHPDLVRRIYNEGHEIGNHTYYHPEIAKVMRLRADAEMAMTRRSIEAITGRSTSLFRPPYNQYVEPQTVDQLYSFLVARHQNYLVVSESIDPLDWEENITPDTIMQRIKDRLQYGHIILLHDAGGKREATIEALPRIIRHFKEEGYSFVTLADLMGKSREDVMPLPHQAQRPLIQAHRTVLNFTFSIYDTLKGVFYVAIVLSIFRILFIGYFAFKQKNKADATQLPDYAPPLSIIVPAYNEEVGAVNTIASLLHQNYPDFEVVFVDDGSKDATFEVVKAAYGNHPQVQILTKANGGKASALNFGLKRCKHEIVVCIDADTQLDKNALTHLTKPFIDPKIGAVAGNVKVGNQVNMLTRWQSIEYITAQNFDRMAFAYLNCITVVPGAIGAFRRKALGAIGWYETDTLAEDCDLTVRIVERGYSVTHTNDAIAVTEAPETYKQFLKQRFRWCFGVMQAFWKNKHVLFNKNYGTLGWVAFPNILIFGLILPLLALFLDFTLVINFMTVIIEEAYQVKGQAGFQEIPFWDKYRMVFMYAAFVAIDVSMSAIAFIFQKEPLWKLVNMLPQRVVYRPLMYYVLIQSYIKALKGELMGWGVLKRTGNVGKINPTTAS